jgi:MFS family permease
MSLAATSSSFEAGGVSRLWNRQLDGYPDTARRFWFLGITVLCTVTLYYELYVTASVSTLLLVKLHMSFTFFVYGRAFASLIAGIGSLFGGIADRVGRANLVVGGLLVTGLMVAFVVPASTGKWEFTLFSFLVFLVEGVCLVATPALIRDFSPQAGRATAMGFWTSGPVVGSLVVFVVASHTIGADPSPASWVHEYKIAGIVGLVVFVIAAIWLRELSRGLRDQMMVTVQDRALIEAKAKGIEVEASLRHPRRQMLKPDVVIPSLGIALFLLFYFTAVGFALIYFTTVFGFSVHDGNALGNWAWGFNVIAVILFGIISDRLGVRKPVMIVGGVGAAVMMVVYLEQIGHPTSYYHMAVLVGALTFCLGAAYVPWMASFTETLEAHNPALTASGLAIWGWTGRMVVFVSYLLLPVVVHSVTPVVEYGAQVKAYAAQYGPQLAVVESHPAIVPMLEELEKGVTPAARAQAQRILGPTYLQTVAELNRGGPGLVAAVAFVDAHGTSVASAAKNEPDQWKNWYWVCFGGMVIFLMTVPLMRGRWSPKAAKADQKAHEALVEAEMARIGISA